MTSSDRFLVHVRSAVKSNFTDWCCQNLSKRALNALTVQASTTELGKLFCSKHCIVRSSVARIMDSFWFSLYYVFLYHFVCFIVSFIVHLDDVLTK